MADTIAPKLTSLHFLPVDVTNGSASSEATATVVDPDSASVNVLLTFDVPLEQDSYDQHGVNLTTTFDSLLLFYPGKPDSTGVASLNGGLLLSRTTKAGSHVVTSAVVTDAAGNSTTYSTADLAALGFDTTLTVTGDATPPSLNAVTLPGQTAGGPLDILSLNATETGSNSPYLLAVVNFDQPIGARGGQGIYVNTDASYLLGNTLYDFGLGTTPVYSMTSGTTASIQLRAAPGSNSAYSITGIALIDYSGNEIDYTATQLRAMGFATSFTVPSLVSSDFDGNGYSDILWRNSSGALSTWSASVGGARDTITQDTSDARADPSWHVSDTFDWNGDGKADILWRNDNGAFSIWTGAGSGFRQGAYTDSSVPTGWSIAGTGDLNGDGRDDILWRNDSGAISSWVSTGTGFQQNAFYDASAGASWKVEGLGDFNGDGKADILWRNTDGSVATWTNTGAGTSFNESAFYQSAVPSSWHVAGIGDFNADGKADILWQNDNGAVSVWLANAQGFTENSFGASTTAGWSIAQVGDFNGDGKADILWSNTAGAVSIWHSTGTGWDQNSYYAAAVGQGWTIAAHKFP